MGPARAALSLPGALWRIYLLRLCSSVRMRRVRAYLYQRGTEVLDSIDPMVAGAQAPTGPDEITALGRPDPSRRLHRRDFAIALDRAAAFCRIMAAGATSLADDAEAGSPDAASELTRRAARFATTGQELTACAGLQRSERSSTTREARAAGESRAARPRNASRRMAARSGE